MYEEDFVTEEAIELDIEGKKFKYKPTTAGEENDWLNEYMEQKDGKPFINASKLNRLKLQNVVGVPYDKELIKKITGIDKEWKDMNKDERWSLFSKLKSSVFDKLITAIAKYDSGTGDEKKN